MYVEGKHFNGVESFCVVNKNSCRAWAKFIVVWCGPSSEKYLAAICEAN